MLAALGELNKGVDARILTTDQKGIYIKINQLTN
jgi:hypothetical protein